MKWPRWASVTFYLALTSGFVALLRETYLRGYDISETLGFFFINLGRILGAVVLFGLLLNAAVFILDRAHRKRPLTTLSLREMQIIGWFVLLESVLAGISSFVLFWHPFGWFWSSILGLCSYVPIIWIGRKIYRRYSYSEEELFAFQDKVLAAKEEKNPLYFIP